MSIATSDASPILHLDTGRSMPTHRQRILVEMLERHDELTSPLASSAGIRGTGDRAILMPHAKDCRIHSWRPPTCTCYRRSVNELDRLITTLRDDRHGRLVKWTSNGQSYVASPRKLWWHLNGWYLDVQHAIRHAYIRADGTLLLDRNGVPLTTAPKGIKLQVTVNEFGKHTRDTKPVAVTVRRPAAIHHVALKAVERIATLWGLDTEPMLPADVYRQAA